MFEALISLTLLSMQPPLGNAGAEWAKEMKSFSSETAPKPEALDTELETSAEPEPSSRDLDLSMSNEQATTANVASYLDSETISNSGITLVYSEQQDLPSYEWFEKHQNWISIDSRILKTRGDEALFQCWSPL